MSEGLAVLTLAAAAAASPLWKYLILDVLSLDITILIQPRKWKKTFLRPLRTRSDHGRIKQDAYMFVRLDGLSQISFLLPGQRCRI